MPLVLYYFNASPPVRSVDLVIHALGIPVQYKVINILEKEQHNPEFEKVSPLYTIPAIDDDGFILWESRAIMAYLVSKYGKDDTLYPKDFQRRAIVDQRLHFSNDVFYILKYISKDLIYKQSMKNVPDDHLEKIKEAQGNIETLLRGQQFLAGDTLTIADYSCVTLVDALDIYSPKGDKFPLTSAWVARCQTHMKDYNKVNDEGAKMMYTAIKKYLLG